MSQDGRGCRAFWETAALFAVLTAVFALEVAFRGGGARAADVFDDLGELVAALVAAAICGLASGRAPSRRLPWGLLAASAASWAAGEVVWCYYDAVRHVAVPFPSLADAGYLSAVPLAIAGLLSFPGVARRGFFRLRQVLDAAMIAGSLLFASWALVLGPTFRSHQSGLLKQVLSVSYPASDVAMVSLAVIVALGAGRRDRACLALVMAGIIGFAVSDSGFAYLTATNGYGIGNVLDTGWVLGYLLIGLGALRALTAPAGHETDGGSERVTLTSALIPYAFVSLAAGVALDRFVDGRAFGLFLPVEGLVLVVALSVRQVLTLVDNVKLNRRLLVRVERGGEELRSREERFVALVQHSSDPVTIVGPDGTILFQSPSVRRVLGWDPEATPGSSLLSLMHPEDRPQWPDLVDRLLPHPITEVTAEWRVRHSDGSWRSLRSIVTNLLDEPSIAGLVLNSRDVTAQVLAEQALAESEERFRSIFDQAPLGIFRLDTNGRIVDANRALCELVGRPPEELDGSLRADLFDELVLGGTVVEPIADHPVDLPRSSQRRVRRPDGTVRVVQVNDVVIRDKEGRLHALVATVEDITDGLRLAEDLQQAQQMEALGQLAGGIAHEINTPTQFISDNLAFLANAWRPVAELLDASRSAAAHLRSGRAPGDVADLLEERCLAADLDFVQAEVPTALSESQEGVERVARIVRAMKAFGRPDSSDPEPTDIDRLVDSAITVARNELKYVAEVASDFGALPSVMCFPGAISQVVLNLLVNAAYAVGDVRDGTKERGQINVRTWVDGSQACISIGDTGPGIPPDVLPRIFQPFFTTKPFGRGTGQGLAMAWATIVERHRGSIDVSTSPAGTTFVIMLPLEQTTKSLRP
jgi:PAS domain S-box-containing protein